MLAASWPAPTGGHHCLRRKAIARELDAPALAQVANVTHLVGDVKRTPGSGDRRTEVGTQVAFTIRPTSGRSCRRHRACSCRRQRARRRGCAHCRVIERRGRDEHGTTAPSMPEKEHPPPATRQLEPADFGCYPPGPSSPGTARIKTATPQAPLWPVLLVWWKYRAYARLSDPSSAPLVNDVHVPT
jgi:hypothetical protein